MISTRERRGMGATNAPSSWAEDCNTYRKTRGCQAMAVSTQENTPTRYHRTNLAQFADIRHPYFATGGHPDRKPTAIDADRFSRHGYGDTTLFKEDKVYPSRTSEPSYGRQKVAGAAGPGVGSNRPADITATDRPDLFGTLQQTDVGDPPGKDSWMGHRMVDPARGKGCPAPPPDPKGRRDLFDVLNYRNPGVPSDDSWMGHAKVDPQRGKASALTPAERMGRMTLNHIMEQTILQDPDRDRLMAKGQDKLGDSWIGHPLINPMKGKPKTEPPCPDGVVNSGCNVAEHADLPWVRHRKTPANVRANEAEVKDIINGVAPPGWTPREEWGNRTKRDKPEWNHPGRETMSQTMLPKIAQTDSGRPWQWDDSKVDRRAIQPVKPGDGHPACGRQMLYWKPEEKISQYVQYANKAQVRNNFANGTIRDGYLGTMGSRRNPLVW